MATRTIEVSEETYDRLKFEQRSPDETWDDVLSRALGPVPKYPGNTAAEVLKSLEDGTYPLLGMTDEEIEFFDRMDDFFLPPREPEDDEEKP